jgi:hypothetical protein
MQLYKPSTRGRCTPRTTSSFDLLDDATRAEPASEHMSSEDVTLVRDGESILNRAVLLDMLKELIQLIGPFLLFTMLFITRE